MNKLEKIQTGPIAEEVEPTNAAPVAAENPLNVGVGRAASLIAGMLERKDVRQEDEPFIKEREARMKNIAIHEANNIYKAFKMGNPNIEPMPDELAALWSKQHNIVGAAAGELAAELSSELKKQDSPLAAGDFERDFSDKLGGVFTQNFAKLINLPQSEAVKKLKELYLGKEKT